MSTTAEIERMPLRSMRCRIHAGVGVLASMPLMMRPQKRGQASGSSTRTPRPGLPAPDTGCSGSGTSGAPVTAATSRARPRIDRQSARFGVSLTSSTESSRSRTRRKSTPTGASASSSSSPDASSDNPSSLAEQSMPCDSTPRIAAWRMFKPPGSIAPTWAYGATTPGATFGAPQTTDTGASWPTSTRQTVRRSAFG